MLYKNKSLLKSNIEKKAEKIIKEASHNLKLSLKEFQAYVCEHKESIDFLNGYESLYKIIKGEYPKIDKTKNIINSSKINDEIKEESDIISFKDDDDSLVEKKNLRRKLKKRKKERKLKKSKKKRKRKRKKKRKRGKKKRRKK